MQLENKEAETSLTLFVNIDKAPFDIFIKGTVVRHLEAGEEDKITLYMAQVGAKHLIDRILQEKGIPDSNRDTPERQSLFARILPEISQEINVRPLSPDEEEKAFKKRIEDDRTRYAEEFKTLRNEQKSELEELKEQVKELTKQVNEKKVGRPPKETE